MGRLMYKPVGLVLGIVGSMLAGAIFKRVWRAVASEDDAPDATDEERGWDEILMAAALHGAIFAIIKAAVDRGGAEGVRRLTGNWPVKSRH
jgi:hypothetical protein